MNKGKKNWELYKIINKKLGEETHEIYLIHSAYLIVSAGLMAFVANSGNLFLSVMVAILGIIVASFWLNSITREAKWRKHWHNKAVKIERKLNLEDEILEDAYINNNGGLTITQYFKVLSVSFIIAWGIILFYFTVRGVIYFLQLL